MAWGLLIKSFFKKENRSHQVPGYNKNIRRIRNNKKCNLENDEPAAAKRLSSRTRKINLENDQSPQIWHPCAFSFGSIDVHQLLHAGNQGLAVLNDHSHHFDYHHHLDHHHHLGHHHHRLCHHYYIFFVIITRVIINSTFFVTFSWSSFPAEFWIPKEIRWRRACAQNTSECWLHCKSWDFVFESAFTICYYLHCKSWGFVFENAITITHRSLALCIKSKRALKSDFGTFELANTSKLFCLCVSNVYETILINFHVTWLVEVLVAELPNSCKIQCKFKVVIELQQIKHKEKKAAIMMLVFPPHCAKSC